MVVADDNFINIESAAQVSPMGHCIKPTETLTYDSPEHFPETGKYWQCPVGITGRYVYLYFENPASETCLVEVEVYEGIMSTDSTESGERSNDYGSQN